MATSETQRVRDFMAARLVSPVIEARAAVPEASLRLQNVVISLDMPAATEPDAAGGQWSAHDPVSKDLIRNTGWSDTVADDLMDIHTRLESSK